MGSRRKSRELAMQMLFQGDLGKQKPDDVERVFWESRDDVDDETRGFADDLHRLATRREDEVDALITKHAQNWRLERMAAVDRNLLRTAVAEMIGFPKTPAAVIINESLEIARRYAAPESVHFLNGVLDAVVMSEQHEHPGQNALFWRAFRERVKGQVQEETDEFLLLSAQLYAQRFTDAELDQLIAFYSSGIGAKYFRERQELDKQELDLASAWSEQVTPRVLEKVRAGMNAAKGKSP